MTEIDAETRYLLRFKTGTYDEYESIALKDPFTLYFTYDTQQLFRGDKEYTKSAEIIDELPETGISGKMYIVSGEDKSSLYFWDRNNNNYKRISDLYKERNVVFVTEVPEFENSRQETLYVYTDGDNNTHIYYKGEESMIDALKIDQTYSATSTNAQSGIAVAEALKTIVKDLDQVSPVKTVDKWEYNKFYKNVNPEWLVHYDYVFDDRTSQTMGVLLPISIVVKYKEKVTVPSGTYNQDIVYNFDGQKVRKWVIDPVNKTIVLNEFVPIDKSQAITEINETVTNKQYPTALAVKDYVSASIDQTYSSESAKAQSGVAVAEAITALKTEIISGDVGAPQKQVDWEQSDNTQVDYIKNKPFYEETIDTTHFFVEDKEVEVDPNNIEDNMHWDGVKFTELTVGELYNVKFKLTKADGSYKEIIYTDIECVDAAQQYDIEEGACPSLMSFPEGLPADYYPPATTYHSNTDNLQFMLINNIGESGPWYYDPTKCQYCVQVYTELPSDESYGTVDSELTIHFSVYQGGTSNVGRSDKYLNVLQSDFESSDDTTTNYIRNKPFEIKETVSSKTIELVCSENNNDIKVVQGQLGLEQGQKVHFKHGDYEFDANVGSIDIFHNAIQVSDDVNGIELALVDGQDENGNDFDGYIYSCVTNDNQPVTAELTIRTKETIFNTKYKNIFQADFNETDKNKPNFIKNNPLTKTKKTFEGIDSYSQFDLGVTYYGYIKKNSSAQVTYSPNFYTDNICLYYGDSIYPCFQGNSFTDTDSLWMSAYNNDFVVKLKQDNISLDSSLIEAGCVQYVATLDDEYNASRYVRVINHCKMEADETSPIAQFMSCRFQRAKLSYAENSSVIYFTNTLTEDLFGNTFSICNNEPFNYKVNHKAETINIRDYEEYLTNNSNSIDEITNAIVGNNFVIMPHNDGDSTEVIYLNSNGKYQSSGLYDWDYNFNIAPKLQVNKPSILNNFIQKVQDITSDAEIVQRYTTSKFIPANLDDIKITAYYNGNSYKCSATLRMRDDNTEHPDPSEKTLTATVTIPLNANDIIRYYSYDTNETIETTAGEAGISEFTSMLQILQYDNAVFGMYDYYIVNGSYIKYSLDGVSYSIEPTTNEYIVTNKLDGSYLPQVRVAKVDPVLRSFSDSNENTTISTDTGKLNDLIDTTISNNSTINGLLNNTASKLSNFKNITTLKSLMLDEYNTLHYHNSYKDSNDYQIMEVAASLDPSSRIATHASEDALFSFDFNTKKCMFKYKFNNGDIAENIITFNKDTDKEIYKQIVQNDSIMNINYNCCKIYRIANSYDYQYIQYVIDFDANSQTTDINKCLLITKMGRTDATSDCLGAFIDKTKFNSLTKIESDTGTTVLANGTKIIRYNSDGAIVETDWGVEISTNDYTTKALIGVDYSAQHNSRDRVNFAIVKLDLANNKIKFIYQPNPQYVSVSITTFEISMPEPITYTNWKLLWIKRPSSSDYNLYLMTDSKLYQLSSYFDSSISVANTYTLPTNFGAGIDKSNPIRVNDKINILSMSYSNSKYTLRIASLVDKGEAEFVVNEIEQTDPSIFSSNSSRFRYLKDFNSNTIITNDKVCTIILQPKDGIGSFIGGNKPYKIGIIPNKYTQDEYITKLEERITKLETEIITGLDEVLADIGGR